jgi:hypothetical protein
MAWAESESIEISEMWGNTPQDVNNQTLKVRDSELSLYESKNTNLDLTAEQFVAAETEIALKEEEIPKRTKPPRESSTAPIGQKKAKSEQVESTKSGDKISGKVDYIINKDWSKQIEELDSTGIPINKTVVNLLKMYSAEQIRGA